MQAPPGFKVGPLTIDPSVSYRFVYGDGIPHAPGQQVTTVIDEVVPGIRIGLGPRWSLDYTLPMTFYSNRRFSDTLDQSVSLAGGFRSGRWDFTVRQGYSESSSPLLETAAQTSVSSYSTALGAIYHYDDKTRVELNADQSFKSAGGLADSRQWSTDDWLSYQLTPVWEIAGGLGGGYTQISSGSDMPYERVQGRVSYRPMSTLSLSLHGGPEIREFLGSSSGASITPLFGLSLACQPFPTTSISVSVDRSITPSLFGGQIVQSTGYTANLRQRVLGKASIALDGGYQESQFEGTAAVTSTLRKDHYVFYRPSFSVPFLRHGTLSMFYQYGKNQSSTSGFGLTSRQVGFELAYGF